MPLGRRGAGILNSYADCASHPVQATGVRRLPIHAGVPFQPSRRWQQFIIKIEKEHLCFHCLRVTYVNRLRRAGVPHEVAMRLVNHSSELIHKIYQRERVEDVVKWRDAVQLPSTAVIQPERSQRTHMMSGASHFLCNQRVEPGNARPPV